MSITTISFHLKSSERILYSRKNLKDNAMLKELQLEDRCYINESLCPHFRMIHGKLKSLYKQSKIFSFWVSNGSVRYRTNEYGNTTKVDHVDDLTEVFGPILNT